MSRGFVKEDDLEHAGTDVPERPISPHPNYVTVNGYSMLQKQAEDIAQEIATLANKKEDASAQQKLAVLNRDLRYVSARLESALVTKPDEDSRVVLFGAKVAVENDDGEQCHYEIVGEDEADIHANKVSWVSPLAKALIGHKIGETVIWQRPAGNTNLEIIEIHY